MRKMIYAFFVLLLSIAYQSGYAQSRKYKNLTANLIAAINSLDSKKILPLLDDDCKISTFQSGMNQTLIPLIFNEKFPKISTYEIIKEQSDPDGVRVFLKVLYANGKKGKPDFVFSRDGKVKIFNIVNQVKAENSMYKAFQPLSGILPNSVTLSFELSDNLIFVVAEVDGRRGWLQFDSGSAFSILNDTDLSEKTDAQSKIQVTGINGASTLGTYRVDSLKLGSIKIENFNIKTVKNQQDDGSMGLIGFDIFKDYEITFDYNAKKIILNKVDSLGNFIDPKTIIPIPAFTTSFILQRHIPIVKLKIDDNYYSMGMDCGANSNVFFINGQNKTLFSLKNVSTVMMNGLGDKESEVKTGLIEKAYIGTLPFDNMQTAFTENNMANANTPNQLNVDGILGYPFFKQYRISINFIKKQISFFLPDTGSSYPKR